MAGRARHREAAPDEEAGHSQDAVTSGPMGFATYDHSFVKAGFSRADVGLDYRSDKKDELGSPMTMPHEYGATTFTPRRSLITYSVPIPYDASLVSDPNARADRLRENERDGAHPDLPQPALQALFVERDQLMHAAAPALIGPPPP